MPRFFERVNLIWLAAGFWLVFAVSASLLARHGIEPDTDAAMRLAGIRDLLAGQSWFDTTQWRMDVPFGLAMHWSRLVDAPIAAIILGLRPFLGAHGAESAALWIWPEILFFAVLLALARIAQRLGGRASALVVLFLGLCAVGMLGLFAPGAIDHHNVQLALTLWALTFLIEEKYVAAAIAVAVSLGVGIETSPYALAAILAVTLSWAWNGDGRARRFGLALGGAAALLLFATTAARYRFAGACDTYSLFYAAPLLLGGVGLATLASRPRPQKYRWIALMLLAASVIGLAAAIEPACLAGPYAQMDPRLGAIFLARINEAHSALSFAHFAPSEFVAGYCYAFAAFLATFVVFRARREGRTVTLFAGVALAVASIEVREVPFAIAFALPGLAVLITRFGSRHGAAAALAALLLASEITFAFAGSWIEGGARGPRIAAFEAQIDCASPAGIAPLAALPTGRVAAFVDQGPAILAGTKDAVIAGPYHRDGDGILDTYAIFTGTPDQAAAILKRRGIDYLMVCSAAPDWNYYVRSAPDGLLARIKAGHAPSFLVPAGHDASTHVHVFRVKF